MRTAENRQLESRFASIETIKAGDQVWTDWDMERMKQGKAPQRRRNGKWESKELHHKIPRRKGESNAKQNLKEVWPDEHAQIDPYRHVRSFLYNSNIGNFMKGG